MLFRWISCFVLFIIAASASFSGFYQKWHFQEAGPWINNSRASFEGMVDGTAGRPFVYRQLLPTIANYFDRVVPTSFKSFLYNRECNPTSSNNAICSSPTARTSNYFFRYLVIYIATFSSSLLAVFAMYFACRALDISQPASVFAAVIVILLIPYFEINSGYFYDYSELAFMALTVWVALKYDWYFVIPIVVLGVWNKESFIFFVPTLYPIFRRRHTRSHALVGTVVLGIICALIYGRIRAQFAGNSGSPLEFNLQHQLQFFLHPQRFLISTGEIYGVRVPNAFTVVPMALLIWTVWRAWHNLPQAIRRHAQVAALINIPLYLLFCFPGELRNLSMLYMTLLLVLATNLNDWIEKPNLIAVTHE
jgi:hypothetical protein